MECGICRTPFKIEYFSEDNELIKIYKTKINQNRRINNNNNSINVNILQSNRSYHNSSYFYNTRNLTRITERDNRIRNLSENNNNIFIVLCYPNKFLCIVTLFVNVLISGLGTLILGVKYFNLYEFFLSLMQFGFCYPVLSQAIKIKQSGNINGIEVNNFLWIYSICIASLFYLSSIYIGIFHNFIFFNPRTIKNKEMAICILILNLIIGGLGTIFYGILSNVLDCCHRIKMFVIGIVQFFGFLIFIFSISYFGNRDKIFATTFLFIVGFLMYISSIYTGVKCYKNMININI